jgi:hypothetical protein
MVNVGLICGRKAARAVAQCVGSRSDSFWHETADTRERPYGRTGEFAKVMEATARFMRGDSEPTHVVPLDAFREREPVRARGVWACVIAAWSNDFDGP